MRRHLRRPVFVLAMSAIMVGVMVAPAGAAPTAKNTQISGTGEFVDECDGETSLFTIELTPSASGWGLDGCWYTTTIVEKKANPNGTYQERGTETFVGSLTYNGAPVESGEFDTTYLFSAKFTPDYAAEIHGRCQHPIVAGSGVGAFDGSAGRVDFKDDVSTGTFHYRGHVKINS